MGGAAYVIYGKYTHINSENSGFFSRIFSRKNKIKNIEKLISKELKESFLDYIKSKVEDNGSNISIKNYLQMEGIFDCLIREYDGKNLMQIYFSGCAGMAQISSELSAHWVFYWYRDQKDEINNKLKSYGFEVSKEIEEPLERGIFVPADIAGYAKFILDEESKKEIIPGYTTDLFEVDEAYMEESGEEEFVKLMKELNIKNSEVIKERKCLCDMCKEHKNN